MGRIWELVEELNASRVEAGQDAGMPPAPVEARAPSRPEAPPDHLADLLDTPIHKLTSPLAVESSVLGDTIYIVANDHQAATVRATGGVPYTPEEVDILWELHEAVKPEVWAERLKFIHEAKKRFQGRLEP